MYRTASPVTAPSPLQPADATCPRCGTPVSGITATEPGRHEFVDCGHPASTRSLRSMTAR